MTSGFSSVAVAGTFDTLHEGHQNYLRTAARIGQSITVFVADATYAGRKKHIVASSEARTEQVMSFLIALGVSEACVVVRPVSTKRECADLIVESDIEAIVVEPSKYPWVEIIQDGREARGKPPIVAVVVARARDETGRDWSASTIRKQNAESAG